MLIFRPDDELTDAQRTLIGMRRNWMAWRGFYLATVHGAPWLQAIDRGALVALATAMSMHTTALDPNSKAARAGKLYARIITRQVDNVISWARVLGLTPRGRVDLGITLEEVHRMARSGTVWPAWIGNR